jgi:hypothetical protein
LFRQDEFVGAHAAAPKSHEKINAARDEEKFRCQSAATVLQKQPIALLKFAPVSAQTTSG